MLMNDSFLSHGQRQYVRIIASGRDGASNASRANRIWPAWRQRIASFGRWPTRVNENPTIPSSRVAWRASVNEDRHYCFAVALRRALSSSTELPRLRCRLRKQPPHYLRVAFNR